MRQARLAGWVRLNTRSSLPLSPAVIVLPGSEDKDQGVYESCQFWILRCLSISWDQNPKTFPDSNLPVQQSSLPSNPCPAQLSLPQTKEPEQWSSLSQSPSPSEQGFSSVQHALSSPLHLFRLPPSASRGQHSYSWCGIQVIEMKSPADNTTPVCLVSSRSPPIISILSLVEKLTALCLGGLQVKVKAKFLHRGSGKKLHMATMSCKRNLSNAKNSQTLSGESLFHEMQVSVVNIPPQTTNVFLFITDIVCSNLPTNWAKR